MDFFWVFRSIACFPFFVQFKHETILFLHSLLCCDRKSKLIVICLVFRAIAYFPFLVQLKYEIIFTFTVML